MTAGHLLQPTTPVLALFIDGEPLRPESRHTRLYAKFRHRLDEVRAGRARLGIEQTPTSLTGALRLGYGGPSQRGNRSIEATRGFSSASRPVTSGWVYTARLVTAPALFFAVGQALLG